MSCQNTYYDGGAYKCYFTNKPCPYLRPNYKQCQLYQDKNIAEIIADLRILYAKYLHRSDDSNAELSQAYFDMANDIKNLIDKYNHLKNNI